MRDNGRRWWRRSGGDPGPVTGTDPVGEAEALLGGRLVEHLRAERAPVPTWAWVNVVAHGSLADLDGASRDHPFPPHRTTDQAWRAARATAARMVLDAVGGRAVVLAGLQRRALIPLEMGLAGGWGPAEELTPDRFLRLCQVAIAEHPCLGGL